MRRSIVDVADDWHDLPPLADLVDGVNRFTRYYFQLGFIPKQQYLARLRNDHHSVNLFLLLAILSISARLSPSLRARYGTGVRAAEFFMGRASDMAIGEVYQEPTLERCQAFYLLSIAQQGSGLRNKSYVGPAQHENSSAGRGKLIRSRQKDQHGHRRPHGCLDATAPRRDVSGAKSDPGPDHAR